jgi:hypothetical protein
VHTPIESVPDVASSAPVRAALPDSPQKEWTIQVQAQFRVRAATFEDACDLAVDQAMEMDSTEWGTTELQAQHFEVACEVDDSGPEIEHFMTVECECGMAFTVYGSSCKTQARVDLEAHIASYAKPARSEKSVGESSQEPPAFSPFLLDELREAAGVLALEQLVDFPASDAWPATTKICTVCMRGTIHDRLDHAATCSVGRVVRALSAIWAIKAGMYAAEEEAVATAAAVCGDSLYDPSLDRHLVCSLLVPHHGRSHHDAEVNLHWDGDEDVSAKFVGKPLELMRVLEQMPGFEGAR